MSSLSIALSHAVAFLTAPLEASNPAATVAVARTALDAALTAHLAPHWFPNEPRRGAGDRCLILSEARIPPRALTQAAHAARIRPSRWLQALCNGDELDLWIDPGKVSVRRGPTTGSPLALLAGGQVGEVQVIWSAPPTAAVRPAPTFSALAPEFRPAKIAKPIQLELDDEFDAVMSMSFKDASAYPYPYLPQLVPSVWALADEDSSSSDASSSIGSCDTPPLLSATSSRGSSPSRSSPSLHAAAAPRALSPTSWPALGQRAPSPPSSFTPSPFAPPFAPQDPNAPPRAPRTRKPRRERNVHVDVSKCDTAAYDGGRTTVMTGGVMLGKRSAPAPAAFAPGFAPGFPRRA